MLKELYKAYCDELDQYDISGKVYPADQAEQVFDRYREDRRIDVKPIEHCGTVVGFLITASEHSHVIICEAYIRPGFRRHGIMRREIARLLEGESMCVFMIYDRNEPAKKCWSQLMKENGFELIGKNGIDKGLTEYFYCRERGEA